MVLAATGYRLKVNSQAMFKAKTVASILLLNKVPVAQRSERPAPWTRPSPAPPPPAAKFAGSRFRRRELAEAASGADSRTPLPKVVPFLW